MYYVLLDTNIIIDMVVDRRNQINNKLLNKFVKLLDFDEIKLVVPEIIKTETYRHLDKEINNVGKQIKQVLDGIGNLYGVSTLEMEGLDLSVYKKKARKELNDALTLFDSKREAYKADIFKSIDLIFGHKNCIQIEDISLMDRVLKRKIYKRAPFHKVEKESNGDGVITESLININQFVAINENDMIFFVTGNYKDFSNPNEKDELHPDILEDLQKKNLIDIVKYISSFQQLIGSELRDNVKNAELIEEMEEDMKARTREIAEQYESDIEDIIRESVGLSSLSSFERNVEEALQLSDFGSALNNLSEGFSSIKDSIEELKWFYEEGFLDVMLNVPTNSLKNLLRKLSEICPDIEEDTLEGLFALQQWLKEKYSELLEYKIEGRFECIEYGKNYDVYSLEQEEYTLEFDEMYLLPSTGEKDEIDIRLRGEYEDEVWYAQVDISYDKVELDDDGGIADAFEEGISLKDNGIVDKLKELLNEWESFIAQEERIRESIEDIFDEVQSEDEEV